MSSIFCCSNTQPFKNRTLTHEQKFRAFMSWAKYPTESSITDELEASRVTHAIQLVKQVNYGPLESKRYFVQCDEEWIEVSEKWLIDANFEKLNTFKNYKCVAHNKFFEVNVYQKDPVNKHHWRADIARPAAEIDL